VFSGLLKWGFWPAAVSSAFLFTVFHLDPGSFIPFVLIGIGLAWLYWSRGTIWDSIIFHFFFNSASFVFLAWGS
jgi:membrane protease YdiL (CAAX protease family)